MKSYLQKLFKKIGYSLYFLIYGRIKSSIESKSDSRIKIKTISQGKNLQYNIYQISEARLYTDRIQDTAVLLENFIIEGPSFQLRNNNNSSIKENIVFQKGTPRKLRRLKGRVLSLLTGGAGNDNYWHWIFDVLPRLGLCEKIISLDKIDHFLLPSSDKKFHTQSFKYLGIDIDKLVSSEQYRHIKSDELFVTDHPYVVTNNAARDIHNIPEWVSLWLKKIF